MALTIGDRIKNINPDIGVIANEDGLTYRIGVEDVNSDEMLALLGTIDADTGAMATTTGGVDDAVVAAGAVGTLSAKLRRLTTDVAALLTGIVLAAGTAVIGWVGINLTKTIQTELLAITKVAADTQQKSSELALTNIKKVALLIDHGRTATTAFVVAGTEYAIQVSQKATGNDTWRTIASVVAEITAASEITADGDEAAAQTLIEIGATTPAVGDIVFWENNTALADSEWMKVVAITGGTDFTILDGLNHAQEAAKKIYNKAQQFVLSLDVEDFTRLRVVVNNNNGTTNVQVASRIAAITQT